MCHCGPPESPDIITVISTLAEQTNNSTGEIGRVINDVLEKTATAVKTIGEAQASIESGAKLSRKSGEVLEKIVGMSEWCCRSETLSEAYLIKLIIESHYAIKYEISLIGC
jgi:DNA-directed RNA polymerase subunit N (RpoN/RPB10)